MVESMGWFRGLQVLMAAVIRDLTMDSGSILASQVAGENRMGDAAMVVPCLTVMVVRFWMDVEERERDRPEDGPKQGHFSQVGLLVEH
ncbi:MAG: hypothetical protein C4534_01320 [Gaiellales bacterium]|nr:MAG: hypothetical protein C4534_01320 [Gaiellales bacterium]